jgi:mRNA (guanine-N7-)-methyltransferase
LRENKLKFDKKQEALSEHETTWKENGLSNLNYKLLEEKQCGFNCEIYTVELNSGIDENQAILDEKTTFEDIQEELSKPVLAEPEDKKNTPAQQFDNLIHMFYENNLFQKNPKIGYNELEARFATKGIKPLTKNDYDNVVKMLKSLGFQVVDPLGTPSLRIRCEFLDSKTGKYKMSDVRTQIDGIVAVEEYCKTNDIRKIYTNKPNSVHFMSKRPYYLGDKMVRPVDMNDFNFRISLQTEQNANKSIENYIIENWRKSKKEFRYLNRVTFTRNDLPFLVELSIVKTGNKTKNERGFTNIIPVNLIEDSNVFNNAESYEIEIELNNKLIGPSTPFPSSTTLLTSFRKVIKYVLSGLQGTMYPISYVEQDQVMKDYMKLIWGDDYDQNKRITSQNFIGPNSITLQLTNIAPLDENSSVPNIRKDFVVTEKADGERHLLYIANDGKMYLINTNMDVKFTGAKTLNEQCFNTLLDGELISHDKNGDFINLYAAFDIYYHKKKDIRNYTFYLSEDETDIYKSRYYLLKKIGEILNPISILNKKSSFAETKSIISPIKFQIKKFYPSSTNENIFDGCRAILDKEKENLFEYETDGLIFTHAFYGVGSNVIGKSGPKTKITWEYSFKWKPPQFNTIDFLVTTTKTQGNEDIIRPYFEDGVSALNSIQFNQYKIIELRCGFSEKNDGFLNPCQDIIDDNLPEYKIRYEDKQVNDYLPKRFYPTEPYDPNAGLCNIMLKTDDNGTLQMFAKNGEVFGDNTIVEFSYNLEAKEGWRWEPLRVRHDKTSKLRRGEKEYGNSYKVCNENWKSIHPTGRITEEMLITGENIPEITVSEDTYYNTPAGKMLTEGLKKFHNLYVKKMLISGVSKQGDTLIDFACGKAGDLPKWISAKLSFVFGVDYSKDNLENRIDGACARYLKAKMQNKYMPYALFVHGNSSFNIRDGSAMLNDKAKIVTNAVFGNGPKDPDRIGKGVVKQYGKGDNGFNVSSCQFAMHYFFENPDTLRGFLKNVVQCTKLNGYFIGTAYDGKTLFNKLKKIPSGESVQIVDNGKKIWEVVKEYESNTFEDDSSSIGYKINVFQESINQYIYEYLVNFDYMDRLMEAHGFVIINREEANEFGFPSGSGLFSELYINMLDEMKRNKYKESLYGDASRMTNFEKEISFLNRYFIYKKIREVNVDKLELELSEYEETFKENKETERAVEVAKKENMKLKPKVRKLTKKLLLMPATEATNEDNANVVKQIENIIINPNPKEKQPKEKQPKEKQPKEKQPKEKKSKKITFIVEDDDNIKM